VGVGATRAFGAKPAVRNILIGGDSISTVPGTPGGLGYPAYLQALMPTTAITVNAVGGRTTADLYTAMSAQILGGGWTDVVMLIGVNDFALGGDALSALVNLEKLYQNVWTVGACMIGIEITPWASFGAITPTMLTQSQLYNQYLHQHVIPWKVVNTHSLGDGTWTLLPAYNCGDGVHMTVAGQQALAQLVYNGLQ
jgi:lysophospholipase L1-like esterase